MNVLTLGARVIGPALAAELYSRFCGRRSAAERHAASGEGAPEEHCLGRTADVCGA